MGTRAFRFVNTHLETQGLAGGLLNGAQGQELAAIFAGEELPVLLVGNLNSAANADAPAGTTTPTYPLLTQLAGYQDSWTLFGGSDTDGKTCCHDGDLQNSTATFTQRIDFVLLRGFGPVQAIEATMKFDVVGDEPADRFSTTDGLGQPTTLWPSDHAGVVVSCVPAGNPVL